MNEEMRVIEEVGTDMMENSCGVFESLKGNLSIGKIVVYGAIALATATAGVVYMNRDKIGKKIRKFKNGRYAVQQDPTVEDVEFTDVIPDEEIDTED